MQTSSVSNQANPLSGIASANKSSDSNASVTPFNQMLSREIADRHDSAETQKAGPPNNAPAAKQTDGSKANGANGSKASSDDDKVDDKDKKADASDGTGAQAPADMLALVTNLNPSRPAAADAVKDETAATGAIDAEGRSRKQARTEAGVLDARAGSDQKADVKAAKDPAPATAVKPETDLAVKGERTAEAAATAAAAKTDFAADLKASQANVSAAPQPVQQAALPMTQAVADKLTPSVGSPAWDQALGQKVVWMVAGGQQSASLTLNPPDLGPLQVVLNVNNSTAHATFSAAQPEVRQALEAALPRLREMLGDAGIQLGQASVNSGSPSQQQTPDQPPQGARNVERFDNRNEAPLATGRVQPARSGRGMVDTFV